jgi:hypothetical protein
MPWELGYFDGFKPGFVWIVPLVEKSDEEYEGTNIFACTRPSKSSHHWLATSWVSLASENRGLISRLQKLQKAQAASSSPAEKSG